MSVLKKLNPCLRNGRKYLSNAEDYTLKLKTEKNCLFTSQPSDRFLNECASKILPS